MNPFLPFTFFLFFIHIPSSSPYRVDKNPYIQREVFANGKYVLEWHVNLRERQVTFNVTAETTGFVGLGFNRKGVMNGADVVVGGVLPSGRAYLSDRHVVGRQLEVDNSQDYTLHEARENSTHTFLCFSRAFDTCDEGNDLEFELAGDIVSVLFAFGEDDEISYHFENRGSLYVHLLDPDMVPREIKESPPFGNFIDGNIASIGDWNVWSIGKPRPIPVADTSYICTFHKIKSDKQLHAVGYRTILDSEVEERHIHHFAFHRCRPPPGLIGDEIFGPWLNSDGEECYLLGEPNQLNNIPQQYCQEFFHGWAVGGQPLFFPEHMGAPLVEVEDQYYMLQVHYDNRELRKGLQARFALEVFYTENLRKYDAGAMFMGVNPPGSQTIMIPSHSINHTIYGHCGSGCTNLMLPKDGIKLVAGAQHTHLAGRGVRTLHIRNQRHLPMILHDDNYNFNEQRQRVFHDERTVLPGDSIITRCVYDTTDRNGSVTTGGFRTRQEMCVSFLWYYPYIRDTGVYSVCASELKSETYANFLGIQNVTWSDPEIENVVTSPRRNAGLLVTEVDNNIEWTRERRRRLQQLQNELTPVTQCPNHVGEFNEFESVYDEDTLIPYEEPNTCRTRKGRP